MDEVFGEPDRQERDRDQHDAEQGVDRRDAGPAGTVGQREAEHEVGRVEEEEHQEEHQLRSPQLHQTPHDVCPDRAGDEGERPEDRPHVHGGVALQVEARFSRPEGAAPSTPPSRSRRRPSARSARAGRRSAGSAPGRRPRAPTAARARGRSSARREPRARCCRHSRDHILKARPGKYRENGVLEPEKGQVLERLVGDARPDSADDDRDRQRQEEQRQEARGPARRPPLRPGARPRCRCRGRRG